MTIFSGVHTVRGHASKSAHPVSASVSALSHVIQWLIDWLSERCSCSFFPFFVGNHFRFRLHFCFKRSTTTMPIGRLELAEFGRFVSGKYRFLKCSDFSDYHHKRIQTGYYGRSNFFLKSQNRFTIHMDLTTDDSSIVMVSWSETLIN